MVVALVVVFVAVVDILFFVVFAVDGGAVVVLYCLAQVLNSEAIFL